MAVRLSVGTDWSTEERFQHLEVAVKPQGCCLCLKLTAHLSHTGFPLPGKGHPSFF